MPFDVNPATLLVLASLIALAVLAVRRLMARGMCDCGDHCGSECGGCSGSCGGCAGSCGPAEHMVANLSADPAKPKPQAR